MKCITRIAENKALSVKEKIRVAAYCRVSTASDEQLISLDTQKAHYEDYIKSNSEWEYAGVFFDEGITGTKKECRDGLNSLIDSCEKGLVDLVITKSISRFARNTIDCLKYVRQLKEKNIVIIFEKENINSLEEDSELRITLSGAFAQSESESISANVTWGKRRAMEAGKVSIQYKKLYGYRKGEDGQPEIIPEQAEIVRWLYERYLTGASLRMIKEELEQQGVKCFEDSPEWTISRIRSILQNEKYCGDVLMQKTFRQDFINRKAIKNTGQLPMYLIENHHEGIVSREKYDAVQAEMARRNAAKSPSKNAVTGMASYASKYALSERLVCGECGTLYRRCTWTRNGEKRVVWRCVSRLDYGKKYCLNSITVQENDLHAAIVRALKRFIAENESTYLTLMKATIGEAIGINGSSEEIDLLTRRIDTLNKRMLELVNETVAAGKDVESSEIVITDISGVNSTKPELIDEVKEAEIITTAVGVRILPIIAPSIAEGIKARKENGSEEYLNIIACENAVKASSQLKEAVYGNLNDEEKAYADKYVGFPDCSVDRIVPPVRLDNPIDVVVENYYEWNVEEASFKGAVPQIEGMNLADNLMAYIERKLFTLNTGHCITAYLGNYKGFKTIDESIADEEIFKTVKKAMQQSGMALVNKYGFDKDAHFKYIDKILNRFKNPYLVDDTARVGREPLRKLSATDRLTKPTMTALEYGLPVDALLAGMAAALKYDNAEDPQSVELQDKIKANGVKAALKEVSGITDEKILDDVVAIYEAM